MLPITSIIHARYSAPLLLAPVPDHSTKRNETKRARAQGFYNFSQEKYVSSVTLLIIDSILINKLLNNTDRVRGEKEKTRKRGDEGLVEELRRQL